MACFYQNQQMLLSPVISHSYVEETQVFLALSHTSWHNNSIQLTKPTENKPTEGK